MAPFLALYWYDAPFIYLAFGDKGMPKTKYWLQGIQDILKVLKENM